MNGAKMLTYKVHFGLTIPVMIIIAYILHHYYGLYNVKQNNTTYKKFQ